VTDIFPPEKRSEIMRRIRQPTKLEQNVREEMEKLGFRYAERGFGDFVNHEKRVAIFIMGCFWHGCPRHYREPKSNVEYWRWKLIRNRARDARHVISLLMSGYTPLVIWECEDDSPIDWVRRAFRLRGAKRPPFTWVELGYLVGYAMGDGSVSKYREDRSGAVHYIVHFYGEEEDIEGICRLLRKRGVACRKKVDSRESKFGTSYQASASSWFLYNAVFLCKLHNHLLAFPSINEDFDRGLLAGFFDADGGWNSGGRGGQQARFFSKWKENLEQVRSLLQTRFGIDSVICKVKDDLFYLAIYNTQVRKDLERWRELYETTRNKIF
jgi:DNA mismatch endonuclease (patch repair protein)